VSLPSQGKHECFLTLSILSVQYIPETLNSGKYTSKRLISSEMNFKHTREFLRPRWVCRRSLECYCKLHYFLCSYQVPFWTFALVTSSSGLVTSLSTTLSRSCSFKASMILYFHARKLSAQASHQAWFLRSSC